LEETRNRRTARKPESLNDEGGVTRRLQYRQKNRKRARSALKQNIKRSSWRGELILRGVPGREQGSRVPVTV